MKVLVYFDGAAQELDRVRVLFAPIGSVMTQFLVGDPAREIVGLAARTKPELIVAGVTRGRRARGVMETTFAALEHTSIPALLAFGTDGTNARMRQSVFPIYPEVITMSAFEDGPAAPLNAELREALDAYRNDSNKANWNRLSQLYVGQIQVLDALKTLDPTFPDPYPLAAADLAGPDFLEWPALPDPGTVLTAVLAAVHRGDHA